MINFICDYGEGKTANLLLVDLPESWSIERLADNLYNQSRDAALSSDLSIVRLPVGTTTDEFDGIDWSPLRQRLPNQAIFALFIDGYKHLLSANFNSHSDLVLDSTQQEEIIDAIRQTELESLAIESRALIKTNGSHLFKLPSQLYSDLFIRVGNIQTNKRSIDAVVFWMFPWMESVSLIVTETWTISSISLNASRLLAKHTKQVPCHVEMVSQYHDGSTETLEQLDEIVNLAANQAGRTLFLISACMSGNLRDICQQRIVERMGSDAAVSFLSIYLLDSQVDIDHLCSLSHLGFSASNFVEARQQEPIVIDIDKTTYFPSFQADRTVRIKADSSMHKYGRDALEAYKGKGFVSCHRDSFDSTGHRLRHHAVYLDVSKVLHESRFSERLNEIILGLELPPSLIIVPPNAEGEELAICAAEAINASFGKNVKCIVDCSLTRESDSLRTTLSSHGFDDSVLVIDDVSITGMRLQSYQRDFRIIGYKGRIHYVVGVARPESRNDWTQRKKILSYRDGFPRDMQHTLSAVEMILLPDLADNKCPWCCEQELIRQSFICGSVPPQMILRRTRQLQDRNKNNPMVNGLFLEVSNGSDLDLTTNSIFIGIPASQADVVAAISNKLAIMRCDSGDFGLKSTGFPDRAVLDCDCYLGCWFNDSIIRATILRMATKAELEFSLDGAEKHRREKMLSILQSHNETEFNLSAELVLGSALGRLPPINLSSIQSLDLDIRGIPKLYRFLRSPFHRAEKQ